VEYRSFLQSLSSVEKRYGRSIVDIRRQLQIWEEMLLEQELLLPEQVLAIEQSKFTASYVSFPSLVEFSGVFDLMKSISRFMQWRVSVGVDLTGVNFSRAQWKSFLLLLKATVSDWTRVWISVVADSFSWREFILATNFSPELDFLGLNLFVPEKVMSCLREGREFDLAGEELTEVYSVEIKEFSTWISHLRRKGAKVRVIVDNSTYREEVPSIGPKRVVCANGVFLVQGEAVPEVKLNLVRFLKRKGNIRDIDWEKLGDRIHSAVRMLDDLVDLCEYPVREIYEVTRRLRRVNLGVEGWARTLCYLGIPYDSDAAVELAERLAGFLLRETNSASWQLARERGVFPSYRGSRLEHEGVKRRNVTILSGLHDIGPLQSLWDDEGPMSLLDEVARQRNFMSEFLLERIESGRSIADVESIPEDVRRVFVLESDIASEWKMKHQAAFQSSWDGLVEIKLRDEPVRESVVKMSLFGGVCALFKELEREDSPLYKCPPSSGEKNLFTPSWQELAVRPDVLFGRTVRVECACGPLIVTVNQDSEGRIREVLLRMEKASGCVCSHLDALGKMLSLLFSAGVDVNVIVKELEGINCSSVGWHKGRRIYSCADAIAYVLKENLGSVDSLQVREVLDEKLVKESK